MVIGTPPTGGRGSYSKGENGAFKPRAQGKAVSPNSEQVKRTNWTDYLVTVDKVESITGYDFFAYLSDDVEETIESKIYQ